MLKNNNEQTDPTVADAAHDGARLIVVSNRVPALHRQAAAGGLASALSEALSETDCLWFGWSGEASLDEEVRVIARGGFELAVTDLTPGQIEGYYAHFANSALWPLCHGRSDLSTFDQGDYACYREVNEALARRLAPLLHAHDTVWVHDYHLIPLAGALRRFHPGLRIGFFLHIPFPETDLFSTLPCAGELLADLSLYDLVGVQTENDRGNLERGMRTIGAPQARRTDMRILACPIGIDAERFAQIAGSSHVDRLTSRFREQLDGRLLIAGAERLDYSKGLPQRMEAYENLIAEHQEWRGNVLLAQIAAPSREVVPGYLALREELETITGRINALHGDFDWVPVRYFNRSFGRASLAALFRQSRVGLVTPLRDGMNLVAKEYVAAQDADDPGVLVLSRFAGAAERMEGALIVNPYDLAAMTQALRQALSMSLCERKARWKTLARDVWQNNVHVWRRTFLARLASCSTAGSRAAHAHPAVARAAIALHQPTIATAHALHPTMTLNARLPDEGSRKGNRGAPPRSSN